jgi:hypothetical protein
MLLEIPGDFTSQQPRTQFEEYRCISGSFVGGGLFWLTSLYADEQARNKIHIGGYYAIILSKKNWTDPFCFYDKKTDQEYFAIRCDKTSKNHLIELRVGSHFV